MLLNIEMDNGTAVDVCFTAMSTGRYPLITKVLDQFQPDEQDIRVLVTRAIQDGDMTAIHAIAKAQMDYLRYFRGNIMTMWLVAHRTIEAPDWTPLMAWVTDEDILIAQSVAIRMERDSAHTGIQYLMMQRLGIEDSYTDKGVGNIED